jgi:cell fate (sporulation/competence/biofilm development) regulator YmcA (YheA/YmcA/DUF963 family)
MNEQIVQELEQIEISIDEAKRCITFRDQLSKLEKNADFTAIFLDDYMKDNALRLVRLKAEPAFQDEKQQAFVTKQLDAIGHLNQYLRTIYTQAAHAEASLAADLQEREAMLAEEV